jgi:hypothetical protein
MSVREVLSNLNVSPTTQRALILACALTLIFTAFFWWEFPPKQYAFTAGEVSRIRITAPRSITFESLSQTEAARAKAAAAVPEVYDPLDPQIGRQQLARAQSVLKYADALRHDPYTSLAQKHTWLAQIPELATRGFVFTATLNLDDARWALFERGALDALQETMRSEMRPEELSEARQRLSRYVSRDLTRDESELIGELMKGFVAPNRLPNPDQTEKLREAKRRAVPPETITILKDQTIVSEGDVITPVTIEKLKALDLLQAARSWRELSGSLLFAMVLASVMAFYFVRQPARLWLDWRRFILLVSLAALVLLSAKFIIPEHNILPYLLPMPVVSMMLALICGMPTAIVVAACLSLAVGQLASSAMALELVTYAFVGAALAALGLQRADRMNAFARAGVLTTLSNVSIILIFIFIAPQPITLELVGLRLGAAGLNAILTVSLTLAGYTLAGHYLGIVTPTQLQELARPTHPLLRQLLLNAPGTYSHTLMISNMAEHAAEAIGADPLLARVASYYHDIGKLTQPFFFIENQANRVNPHDELNDPYQSARIIIQHVIDGVMLARQYRLPRQIVDAIPQHHGTMLVTYFYRVAKQRAPNGEVDERLFRYPGPRPQTREAAIIMLADGAEATTRARHPSTVEELDSILKTIFRDRLLSGELDECDLHLRDLDRIRQAFLEILQGQFHPRIIYPSDPRESLPAPTQGVWLETPTIPEREK